MLCIFAKFRKRLKLSMHYSYKHIVENDIEAVAMVSYSDHFQQIAEEQITEEQKTESEDVQDVHSDKSSDSAPSDSEVAISTQYKT
jgi:hypothetical protein|tara:strand:- start:1786 stop:2043 length:258 start_codon:yes stop_codon:yes gene_type:complete